MGQCPSFHLWFQLVVFLFRCLSRVVVSRRPSTDSVITLVLLDELADLVDQLLLDAKDPLYKAVFVGVAHGLEQAVGRA